MDSWGSGPYVSSPLYAKHDIGESLFTSLPLSEEFGNVDKIGVTKRNREKNRERERERVQVTEKD